MVEKNHKTLRWMFLLLSFLWLIEGCSGGPKQRVKGTEMPKPEARKPTSPIPTGSGTWKVVLDPGHGGKDVGAVGPGGLVEKKVILDIAQRLQRLLQKAGWQAILTRDSDFYVPLEERPVLANREEANLFISLHVNASPRSGAKGIETYFLNPRYNGQGESQIAQKDQTSFKDRDSLQRILHDMRLASKIEESGRLAHIIQSSLVRALKEEYPDIVDLGVKQAPFYVLIGAQMPSVLVEISFLSHPDEEARLARGDYRERIAQGLLEGIERYRFEPWRER